MDGEYKERDSSGDCDVVYESLSTHVIRKIKVSGVWRRSKHIMLRDLKTVIVFLLSYYI